MRAWRAAIDTIDGLTNRVELKERVAASLCKAALWDEVKDRLHESALMLSGGQQQRLCIARTIAVDETHVYVSMSGGGLARALKSATNCKVTPGTTAVASMSLFGEWVYFTDATTVGRIHK